MLRPLHFRCESVVKMTPIVKAYWLRVLDQERYGDCDLGRHVLLNYPDAGNQIQRRYYSIVGKAGNELIEIAVKRKQGDGVSAEIHRTLMEGSIVTADNVGGHLSTRSLLGFKRVIMVCGGIGITQPLGLLRGLVDLYEQGTPVPEVQLIVSASRFEDLIYVTQLMTMQARFSWITIKVFITKENIRSGIRYATSGRPDIRVLNQLRDGGLIADAAVLCGSSSFVADWKSSILTTFPDILVLDQHSAENYQSVCSKPEIAVDSAACLRLANRDLEIGASKEKTLLETLEENGICLPNQCRAGICGRCSVQILNGEVDSNEEIGLSRHERDAGFRLACCSRPRSSTVTLAL